MPLAESPVLIVVLLDNNWDHRGSNFINELMNKEFTEEATRR